MKIGFTFIETVLLDSFHNPGNFGSARWLEKRLYGEKQRQEQVQKQCKELRQEHPPSLPQHN